MSTIVSGGDYDQHVRELAFDKRSKPKDRTKTEEQLALEEKEALEKAERRRQNRMLGQNESDSEEEGTVKRKRKRGADDLDFDEGSGEWSGLGAGLDQTSTPLSEASEEEAEEVGGTSDNESSAKGDAGSDFPCPGSHEEFLQIIEDLDDEDVPTVVHRIRTLYHTSLGADNKFKLQVCSRRVIYHHYDPLTRIMVDFGDYFN